MSGRILCVVVGPVRRINSPPILFPCKHLNFSRTTTEDELLSRKVIGRFDPGLSHEGLAEYADLECAKGRRLVEGIRGAFKLTTLKFQCLDRMKESIGVNPCSLCTYCWDGKD
ncbi:MAG: hypothetical protein FWE70_04325 [Oscillospiraceae bacterium]|nr:hypothetical protein [Oscillospiraceae bacterium]